MFSNYSHRSLEKHTVLFANRGKVQASQFWPDAKYGTKSWQAFQQGLILVPKYCTQLQDRLLRNLVFLVWEFGARKLRISPNPTKLMLEWFPGASRDVEYDTVEVLFAPTELFWPAKQKSVSSNFFVRLFAIDIGNKINITLSQCSSREEEKADGNVSLLLNLSKFWLRNFIWKNIIQYQQGKTNVKF